MPVAIVTGASRGFGAAVAAALAGLGYALVVDARRSDDLRAAADGLRSRSGTEVVAVPGDVTDPDHRAGLAAAAQALGGLDLLVNNASTLGATPLPGLDRYPLDAFAAVLGTNVLAPLALVQATLDQLLARAGAIVNISSDAAVEAYPGWGGYGASKAALDLATGVIAAEQPTLRVYALDPGDMRTDMQQLAFPGEDISDRADPADVAPALVRLVTERPPSGRYRAADLLAGVAR